MMHKHRRAVGWRWAAASAAVVFAAAGCATTPFDSEDAELTLQRSVAEAVARELAAIDEETGRRIPPQPRSAVAEALAERAEELEAIGPELTGDALAFDFEMDLTGAEQRAVTIALEPAIATAVNRNLEGQFARLQPAIGAASVAAAEAIFDAVLFANSDFTWSDQPATVRRINGLQLGEPAVVSESFLFETGVRKPLTTGGQVTVSTDLSRFDNEGAGVVQIEPSPAYTSAARLTLQQPLLRGFGTAVNTAEIRLSRNVERRAIEDLRRTLLDVTEATEQAYWDLVFAYRNLLVQQWLVDVGIPVRDRLQVRFEVLDADQAEYADAVARVEQRQAQVIRAERQVRAASDRLKALVNDPRLTVASETLLRPIEEPVAQPIEYSLRDAVLTAVEHRPEIAQAVLEIDDAAIRETLADNARLPLLNVSAQMAYFGLDDSAGNAYNELGEGRFIDYVLGLNFELPIGNRMAQAEFRLARLERSAAVIQYRQSVQNVILDVKEALRDVVTNYALIGASRSARIAQAENVRVLEVEMENLADLTPTFLNLVFTRQEEFARAMLDESQALVNYAQSVAALYRAMGIGLDMKGITLDVEPE